MNAESDASSPGRRKPFALWVILFGFLVLAAGAAIWAFWNGEEKNIRTADSAGQEARKVTQMLPAAQEQAPVVSRRRITTTTASHTTSSTTTSSSTTTTTTTSTVTTTTMIMAPKPKSTASAKPAAAKPAAAKPRKTSNVAPSQKVRSVPAAARGYSIQFGAFKSPGRAGKLVKDLGKKGVKARVDKISDRKSGILYKVRVGSYKKRSAALAAIKRLRQKTGLECFVARVR